MKVQVNVLYNEASWADKESGYQEGHPLRLAGSELIEGDWKPEEFAEKLFYFYNHGAQGRYERSMSVGDVVTMGDIHLACQPSGWRRVQVNREQVTK